MDRIEELTKDAFNAVNQLSGLPNGGGASPAVLYDRLRRFIDEAKNSLRVGGHSDSDAGDVMYAIVALADEVATGKGEAIRNHWLRQPLQMHYFNENVAGENFFVRLDKLRGDARKAGVLRAYYLALCFGFKGRYAMGDGELDLKRLIDSLWRELERLEQYPTELSPSGDRPDEKMLQAAEHKLPLWLALAALAISLGLYAGLRVLLDGQSRQTVDDVAAMAQSKGSGQSQDSEKK